MLEVTCNQTALPCFGDTGNFSRFPLVCTLSRDNLLNNILVVTKEKSKSFLLLQGCPIDHVRCIYSAVKSALVHDLNVSNGNPVYQKTGTDLASQNVHCVGSKNSTRSLILYYIVYYTNFILFKILKIIPLMSHIFKSFKKFFLIILKNF